MILIIIYHLSMYGGGSKLLTENRKDRASSFHFKNVQKKRKK